MNRTGPETAAPRRPPPRLLISLATYNEADNLRPLVEAIRGQAPHASLLLIDDASPDGTGRVADDLARTLPDVHVIHRAGKQGLGTAYVLAMKYAIEGGYEYYMNLDADFSHPPRFIPALLAGMEKYDVMIGSRYVTGGRVEGGLDGGRAIMSAGINMYARLLLGLTTRDNSGSFRCYRVSKIAQIDFARIRSHGYSFLEEILYRCGALGCTMGETPIVFEERRAGLSKLTRTEAIKALAIILELGVRRALGVVRGKVSRRRE
jgi:dolichol-phosphate mannosyltransferase